MSVGESRSAALRQEFAPDMINITNSRLLVYRFMQPMAATHHGLHSARYAMHTEHSVCVVSDEELEALDER